MGNHVSYCPPSFPHCPSSPRAEAGLQADWYGSCTLFREQIWRLSHDSKACVRDRSSRSRRGARQRLSADVTFVLKNGDRVSGQLVYRHTTDFTVVRDGREQTFPSDDIALIQFTGGDPSRNELEQLPNVDNNPNELERHVFVFRNGNIMRGKLHDIVDNWFDFDAQQGGRRKHDLSELARLYFNPASARRVYNFDARRHAAGRPVGGEIRVEANRALTSTGMNVARGERIAFEANGDIRIGPNVGAGPDGNPDLGTRLSYPVRSMAAGALDWPRRQQRAVRDRVEP